ncbi:Uncharacterized protein HZ326_4552 [Fusarium oxysporum f. sp. albedinis]|nr:Uncharacterized protein HZ326_4552 [Fusarium oxysporum f. sp. albedinis]
MHGLGQVIPSLMRPCDEIKSARVLGYTLFRVTFRRGQCGVVRIREVRGCNTSPEPVAPDTRSTRHQNMCLAGSKLTREIK